MKTTKRENRLYARPWTAAERLCVMHTDDIVCIIKTMHKVANKQRTRQLGGVMLGWYGTMEY